MVVNSNKIIEAKVMCGISTGSIIRKLRDLEGLYNFIMYHFYWQLTLTSIQSVLK